jgi:ketosteroid isomerase-like protein
VAEVNDVVDAGEFAQSWIAEWNSRDLDAIMRHYAPSVVFHSPVAAEVAPSSQGTVQGLAALRAYWHAALERNPKLRFELLEVFVSIETLAIRYRTQDGTVRVEVLRFNDGLIAEGWGFLPGA